MQKLKSFMCGKNLLIKVNPDFHKVGFCNSWVRILWDTPVGIECQGQRWQAPLGCRSLVGGTPDGKVWCMAPALHCKFPSSHVPRRRKENIDNFHLEIWGAIKRQQKRKTKSYHLLQSQTQSSTAVRAGYRSVHSLWDGEKKSGLDGQLTWSWSL